MADSTYIFSNIFGPNIRGNHCAPHRQSQIAAFLGTRNQRTFSGQSFSRTLRVMDVRAENRPHPKVRFSAAPVMGRNFLTQGHPGVRVKNVRGKSGPKSLCSCCFFFPDLQIKSFNSQGFLAIPLSTNVYFGSRDLSSQLRCPVCKGFALSALRTGFSVRSRFHNEFRSQQI